MILKIHFFGYKFSHKIVSYLTVSLDSFLTKFKQVTHNQYKTNGRIFYKRCFFFYKDLKLSVVDYYYF